MSHANTPSYPTRNSESESDHTDSEGEFRPREVVHPNDESDDDQSGGVLLQDSDNEYGIPDQWSVSRDHPFRKDYVWYVRDNVVYSVAGFSSELLNSRWKTV